MTKVSPLSGKKVVVTGATGFIGRRLTLGLCDAGADVVALLRSGHEAKSIRALGAGVVIGTTTEGALDKAFEGADILFNFAYDVRAGQAENLTAFDRVIAAARRSGLRRIIHASSAVVYDDWPAGAITEASAISTTTGGAYRQAKIAMENRLMASTFETAILQPTIVYGPGSGIWTDGPIAQLRAGGVVLPDPVGVCPLVYVDDVVQAAIRAAELPDLGRERFLVSGQDAPTWEDLFKAYIPLAGSGEVRTEPLTGLQERLGPEPQISAAAGPSTAARISAQLRRVLGRKRFEAVLSMVQRLRPKTGLHYPDRSALGLYSASPDVSIDLAKARLGYKPDYDLGSGVAKIVSAYAKAS
ncbi:MAG: NAD-dependent epimerase/dehydratase family protein [Marinosulfonomonas sp.]